MTGGIVKTMIEVARGNITKLVGEPRSLILLDTFMDLLRDQQFKLVGAMPGEEEAFYASTSDVQLDYVFATMAFRHECKCCTYYWSAAVELTDAEPTLDFLVGERLLKFLNRRKNYLSVSDLVDIDELETLPPGKVHAAWIVTRPSAGSPTTRLLVARGLDQKVGLSILNNAVFDQYLD